MPDAPRRRAATPPRHPVPDGHAIARTAGDRTLTPVVLLVTLAALAALAEAVAELCESQQRAA
jgi:hypothetical protein